MSMSGDEAYILSMQYTDEIIENAPVVKSMQDSCYCRLLEPYTPILNEVVPFALYSGNMQVNNGLITVKPGQRVQINVGIGYQDANSTTFGNMAFHVRDITNDIGIGGMNVFQGNERFEPRQTVSCQYTNETNSECQIAIVVMQINELDILWHNYCWLTVHELAGGIINGSGGKGITSAYVNDSGVLIIEYSDGTTEEAGVVKGADGAKGEQGEKGEQGIQGIQGIQGERGEQGETGLQGQQGIQGVKGDKGDDGYPFLIYKQYEVGIEEFNEADFPEIGLMFMIHVFEEDKGYPVYRYTADGTDTPYSLVTYMNTEGIKGEKGDRGEQGEQGVAGLDGKDGKDGTTYTPSIGEVTTVDSTELASATVSVNTETKEAAFNFAIPKGSKGADGVQIDDVNVPSETSVWSSKKTSDEIADIESALEDKADKTDLDGSKKLYITNTGANIKFVKITSAPLNGSSIDIHFKSARTNTTFEEETVRVSAYISKTIYDGKIIQKGLYAANGNKPNENEANFLVILDDYSVWAHIASYSTAEIELYSYGRKQSIDGTEATTLPSEVKYSMFNGAELATMDKVALKQEYFDKKVTLTDSNWKYETITFTKNYKHTPSVNVSCGDYLNTEFYSYWGCEAHIININNKGCTIRYRSSKASESEPLEVNIIVFVNGI